MRGLEADAYEQNGYFAVAQAREHRISSQLLSHYVRQGRFERVRRGLYRLQSFPSAQHDDMREMWLAVGRDKAILSNESALALLGLSDSIPDAIHLLVARRYRGLRRPPGVILHTHPDDEEVARVWREGMPLTTPARTLVDVIERVQPEQASMALQQALRQGLVTAAQLEEEAVCRRKARPMKDALSAARRS
jgi:predicted transcriptional regulator of viral defense system